MNLFDTIAESPLLSAFVLLEIAIVALLVRVCWQRMRSKTTDGDDSSLSRQQGTQPKH
jgi:hypothetical protein